MTHEQSPSGGEAIPAGMKPWHGGEGPPADLDDTKPLLNRRGYLVDIARHPWTTWADNGAPGDIIAYTPKPTGLEAAQDERIARALRLRAEMDGPDMPGGYYRQRADSIIFALAAHSVIPSEGMREALEGLRLAFGRLIRAADAEACSEDPMGIDGSEIDAARDAFWASYPRVFSEDQVAALKAWQDCGWVHQLTCPNRPHGVFDEDGVALEDDLTVTPYGLFCVECDYRQDKVPDVCLGPLPPNPAEYLAALRTDPAGGESNA